MQKLAKETVVNNGSAKAQFRSREAKQRAIQEARKLARARKNELVRRFG